MLQNTEKVTNTKQLQNRFVSVNAFRFDQRRSNTTYSIYESVSAMLSIQDYNDETKIDLCYR